MKTLVRVGTAAAVCLMVWGVIGAPGPALAAASATQTEASASMHTATMRSEQAGQADQAAPPSFQLNVDGEASKHKALSVEQITMLPLSFLNEDLGLTASYDAQANAIAIKAPNREVIALEGGSDVTVNGHELSKGYPVRHIGGEWYVPLPLLTGHMGYQAHWIADTKTVVLSKIRENDMLWTNVPVNKETQDVTVTVQYPQLKGLKNGDVELQINELFAREAERFVDAALEESKGAFNDIGFQYDYYLDYSIKYNRNDVVSVQFQSYVYQGGAHGIPARTDYTINLNTGKVYTLNDLLQSNPNYKDLINAEVKKGLQKIALYEEGHEFAFRSISDNPSFYVKDDGVVVYFGVYEYTPYAAGFPEFYFRFSALLPELPEGELPF